MLFQDSLLAEGLLSLLREQAALAVQSRQLKDPHVEEFLRQFAPDVVVIDQEDFDAHARITIDQLLREWPHTKVVDVSSHDTLARVYQGREIEVTKFEDFLATFVDETSEDDLRSESKEVRHERS